MLTGMHARRNRAKPKVTELGTTNSRIRGIELFSGAGGLSIGSITSGIDHLLFVDKDPISCGLLSAYLNAKQGAADSTIVATDITKVDFEPFSGLVDIITGGPPCQPFSAGGSKRGLADHRDMFPHAVRAVRETRPKAFLFENVAGLIQGRFSDYREYIKLQLEHPSLVRDQHESWLAHRERLRECHLSGAPEYRVILKDDLNAADYGTPQQRLRILFIGIRNDLNISFTLPKPQYSKFALQYSQWCTGEYWDHHKIAASEIPDRPDNIKSSDELLHLAGDMKPWRTLRDGFYGLSQPKIEPCRFGHSLIPGARTYPGHDGSELDWVSKTLKAGAHGVPGGENCLRLRDGSVRYYTLRECARIQGFPDDYTIPLGPWTPIMRAFGNAVPVPVAELFTLSLVSAMRELQ